MKKILLIYPPYERFRGSSFAHFPVGLGYLATMLSESGYDALIYNADFALTETLKRGDRDIVSRTKSQNIFAENALDDRNYIWVEIRKQLEDNQPDLVGVYTTTVTYPIVLKIVSIVKEINRDCVTVLGGPHITVLPDKVMEKPDVDFILMGEAEYTLVELCNELKNGTRNFKKISGLGYRDGDKILINRDYDFIDDLGTLPVANRELVLNKESYPNDVIGGTIIGSRGCPYKCTFCASSFIWKRHIRYRPVEDIVSELKYLKRKYGLATFSFLDDTFTSHKKQTRKFCEELIREKANLNWTCLTRVDLIDDSMLDLLKRSGCTAISVGVESGSDRVLRLMKKGIKVETVRRAAKLIRKHKLAFQTFFMVGLPYETADDIRKTINLIKEIKPDKVNLSTFFPYPGTEAHAEVVKQGLLPEDYDWANNLELGHHSLHNHFTPYIAKEEFTELVVEALEVAQQANKLNIASRAKIYWRRRKFYLANPDYVVKRFLMKIQNNIARIFSNSLS